MTDEPVRIDRIEGTAIPLRGDDIDTDRIVPARFLGSVTFEGLERHVFEDDLRTLDGRPSGHPFANPAFEGASILLVNRNFGCGSSREHAPQGLWRWGIRAIVGESFSEIFFGNATMLGVPCCRVSAEAAGFLMDTVERTPTVRLGLSLATRSLTCGDRTIELGLPDATRDAFLQGAWDPTALLLARPEETRAVADRLPYISGF